MKKLIAILALTLLPILSSGQSANADVKTQDSVENVIENVNKTQEVIKTSSNSKVKMQLNKLNRKKNREIISIKAYRKSLQIKVKTKKLC